MAHDHGDDHDHGELHFVDTHATDGMLAQLRPLHPALVEVLELTTRWGQLSDDEKAKAPEKQREVENFQGWTPGYHAEGDRCGTCGMPTLPLFVDRFQEGELAYAAFFSNIPVHATKECLDGLRAKRPDLSPRGVDRARRELTRDMERPSAGMTQFFRHDLLKHPAFGVEDWANSVAAANPKGLDKVTMRDIEKLARWVHHRLFHGH